MSSALYNRVKNVPYNKITIHELCNEHSFAVLIKILSIKLADTDL